MKSMYASLLMLALCLSTGACSTTPPRPAAYPPPPVSLMEPPPPLGALPGSGPVPPAVAAEVVAENYALYHLVAARLEALQAWLRGVSK